MPVKDILTETKKSREKIFFRACYDTEKNLVSVCQYYCLGIRQQGEMKYHLFFKSDNEKDRYQKQKS